MNHTLNAYIGILCFVLMEYPSHSTPDKIVTDKNLNYTEITNTKILIQIMIVKQKP